MILTKLQLDNFRCFESVCLELDPQLNVFIGGNGSGKSSLLDAVALSLGPVLSHLPELKGPGLSRSDIRLVAEDRQAPFARVLVEAEQEGTSLRKFGWDRIYRRDKAKETSRALPKNARGLKELHEWLDDIQSQHESEQPFTLPVFAHYGTNRAVDVPHNATQARKRKSFQRLDALLGALEPDANFKRAVAWFEQLENQELRQSKGAAKSPLEVVRRAIEQMLPGIKNPRMDAEDTRRFVVDSKNSDGVMVKLFLDQLSDGYQVVLGMVLDFALRLVRANPEHPDPLKTQAIMIVDEVDLHLHPEWQQHVIPDLLRTFPGTQFVLTTHSPQVVSTVRKQFVRRLVDYQVVELPTEIIGAESGRVLVDAFDVPMRPRGLPEVKALEEYIELSESPHANPATLDEKHKEVLDTFTRDEPAIGLSEMARAHRQLLAGMKLELPVIPAPSDEE
jgi:predicted ATP-binding protein involved in virulence